MWEESDQTSGTRGEQASWAGEDLGRPEREGTMRE